MIRMLEIIFFAALTGYLVFRLWTVIGKQSGFQGPPPEKNPQNITDIVGDNVIALPSRSAPKPTLVEVESPDPLIEQGLKKIHAIDPAFDLNSFIRGASTAFRMIIDAYSTGDKTTLKMLLSPTVFKSFAEAIQERQESNQTIETSIVELSEPQVLTIEVKGKLEQITLKFLSEQIIITKDENGNILDNPARLSLKMKDIWTFSRPIGAQDPNWLLVTTRIEGNA